MSAREHGLRASHTLWSLIDIAHDIAYDLAEDLERPHNQTAENLARLLEVMQGEAKRLTKILDVPDDPCEAREAVG